MRASCQQQLSLHCPATFEQDEQENRQASPDEQAFSSNGLEDGNYLPLSEDEVSLGDEDFIIPEEPL